MNQKICGKCKIKKDLSEFHRSKIEKDGYEPICKDCRKLETKKYYDKNKDIIINKVSNYRKINKSYIQTNKKYKDKNRDFVLKINREWSKSDNGKLSKQNYYKKNSEKIKNNVKQYKLENLEKIKEKEYIKRRTTEYKKYMSEYKKNIERITHMYMLGEFYIKCRKTHSSL